MNKQAIKKIYESLGSNDQQRANNFNRKINDLFENKKVTMNDFSVRDIFEAVNSTSFSIIVGNLLSKEFMASYNKATGVGMSLVTKLPSNLKTDKIPGIYSETYIREVVEGEAYHHSGVIKDRYVEVGSTKYGEILDITEEIIAQDNTGLVMLAARNYGENIAAHQEEHIMKVIQDDTNAWYPAGSQTTLYANTASGAHFKDNLITNVLQDYTDLDAAKVLLALMTVSINNDTPIDVQPDTILVPVALETMATRLIKNSVMPGTANSESNPYSNKYKVVSSVYLDGVSSTAWYLGNFKKQYVYKEVIPVQVLARTDKYNDDAWNRDIQYQFKFRYKGKCGARDFRAVVKSDGSV